MTWWEARIVLHLEADSREAADEVVETLFEHDAAGGGNWKCEPIDGPPAEPASDPRIDRLEVIALEGIFDAMGETWTAEQDRELVEKRAEVERLASELTAAVNRRGAAPPP